MFNNKEVSAIFKEVLDKYSEGMTPKLKYIANKIDKYDYMHINLSELNYLYELAGKNTKYDIIKLKKAIKDNSIGYTFIIKNLGIAKATLSKLLNGQRNATLESLNNFMNEINKAVGSKLTTKDVMKEGE